MSSVNKVILVGRLGADPEVRYTAEGRAVVTFRLATSSFAPGEGGEGAKQERTEWHRIVVFGKQADTCGQYLSKGRLVYVEGRLRTRQWDDRDGNRRYMTEIVAQTVQFLGGGGGGTQQAQKAEGEAAAQAPASAPDESAEPPPSPEGEDVPF